MWQHKRVLIGKHWDLPSKKKADCTSKPIEV